MERAHHCLALPAVGAVINLPATRVTGHSDSYVGSTGDSQSQIPKEITYVRVGL